MRKRMSCTLALVIGVSTSKYKINLDGKLFVEGQTIDRKVAATLNPEHFEEPK